MAGKKVVLMPEAQKVLRKMGINIKRARLRRNISAELLAKQARISTDTLTAIEKGASTVSIGAYVAVLNELGMEKDLQLVANDEKGKAQYRENSFFPRERAGRKQVKEEKCNG